MTQRRRVEELEEQVETIKRSFISNLELYGYPIDQAKVQIEALMDAVRKLAEEELY